MKKQLRKELKSMGFEKKRLNQLLENIQKDKEKK